MTPKIIGITNEKGGVGKSTMAATIGGGLAARGHRVLAIDTDPQGHLARLMGLPEEDGLYRLIVEKADWDSVLRGVPPASYLQNIDDVDERACYDLVPSSTRTAAIASLEQDPFVLQDRIAEIVDDYDVVLLDTAPTASMFDAALYLAADAFIYVTVCEALAFDGINKSLAKIERFGRKRAQTGAGPNRLLGIIPNMVRARTENHRMNLELLAQHFGDLVWPPIAERTVWTEASNYGRLVFAYKPDSGVAADAWELVGQAERALGLCRQD